MKKSFLKLGGFIFLATLLSCSTDNESPQHTNSNEVGINNTTNSAKSFLIKIPNS